MDGVGNTEALLDARERRHAEGQYSHAEGSTSEVRSGFDSEISSASRPSPRHLSPIPIRGGWERALYC